MEQFFKMTGDAILLFLLFSTVIFIAIIYIIWSLIKSAIAKGVQDGIYNAIILLHNNGIITDIINETQEIKYLFDPKEPPK